MTSFEQLDDYLIMQHIQMLWILRRLNKRFIRIITEQQTSIILRNLATQSTTSDFD